MSSFTESERGQTVRRPDKQTVYGKKLSCLLQNLWKYEKCRANSF